MKTKILLFLSLLLFNLSGYSTVWTVSNSGTTFTPATITINLGDTVVFTLDPSHDVLEVSQTTWNADGNTALSGGFSVAYGGGTLLPSDLTVGTHYYVCEPHASMGMKGIIIVQSCTAPAQPLAISGNASICSGTSNTYSIAAVSGATSYTWSFPSGWTGTSTTTSITATASTTAGNVSVSANNACGSSAVKTLAVTVNTPPAQPAAITGNASICSGSSNTYSIAAVSGATSYTWTLPVGWSGSSATSTISATASASGGTISVTANNSCGSSAVRTLTVTVNAIPAQPAAITGSAAICSGSTNIYSVAAVSGATSYTWTLPAGWSGSSATSTITAVANANGGTISVTASNSCGSSAVKTLAVTINPIPAQPAAINGNVSICSGSSNTFSVAAVSGATTYTWTLPIGWTGTSTTNSITAVASATAGNISVTANNSCGSSPAQTVAVAVNIPPAQPAAISGNISICSGTSNTYSITAVSGAISYTWILPSGWSGSSATSTITTVAGATGGTISVTANNSCGSSAVKTLVVTVNTIPAQPAAITGGASICSGTSNTYSIAAVSGATSYTWTLPSGWSGSSATSTITATASASGGTISVTANNSCGTSVVKTLVVTVNTLPAQPAAITGSASICSGTSNTYSIAAVSGATSYTWTLPSGWSGSSATSSITAVANNGGGNITVKANNSCGSSATQTLSITCNSVDTAVSLSGSTLTANATGATYQWINCNGNVPISGQMSQSFTAVSSGSYAVIVTKNGCSDTSLCHAVIITGIQEAKANTTFSLYPNPSNGKFTIETNQTENTKIEIYNLIGEIIYAATLSSAKTEIDFSKQKSGVYFLKLNTGTNQITKRIIIQ